MSDDKATAVKYQRIQDDKISPTANATSKVT